MPGLQDILYKVKIRSISGPTDLEIRDLQIDSRKVQPGTAFIAIKGVSADGHAFIPAAVANKASVIVCEVLPDQLSPQIGLRHEGLAVCLSGLAGHATASCPRPIINWRPAAEWDASVMHPRGGRIRLSCACQHGIARAVMRLFVQEIVRRRRRRLGRRSCY